MPDRDSEDWKWVDEKAGYRKPTTLSKNLGKTDKHYIEEITAAIHCVKEELNRSNNEDTPQKQRDRRWDKAGIVGLWLAALVGVWAIVSSSSDADKQREIMKNQIEVMRIQFEPRLSFDFKFDVDGSADKNWRLTPRWKNVGGGEAVDFKGWDTWKYFPGTEPDVRDFLVAPAGTDMVSTTVVPQDVITQATLTIPRQWGINYVNGIGNIILWGYVEYRGPFASDQVIKKHYCFMLKFEQGKEGVAMTLPSIYKSECNRTN